MISIRGGWENCLESSSESIRKLDKIRTCWFPVGILSASPEGAESNEILAPLSETHVLVHLLSGVHSSLLCFASPLSSRGLLACASLDVSKVACWPQRLLYELPCVVSAHWNLAHRHTPPPTHRTYSIRSHPDSWCGYRPKPDLKESPSFVLLGYHISFPFSSPVST